jgi:biopolymer transport protein ExbD
MALSFASGQRDKARSPMPRPMGDMNTTPLIDVMLVLLIMIIITIPVATHSTDFDVAPGVPTKISFDNLKNKIVIDAQDQILWNGNRVNEGQMLTLLRDTLLLDVEPELQFEPDALASYRTSARVLHTIEASGVTKFGFVGNEKYRIFGKTS